MLYKNLLIVLVTVFVTLLTVFITNNIENSIPKKNPFFQQYAQLDAEEQWEEIVDLGLKSIRSSRLTNKESAIINFRIANSYYNMGDFDESIERIKEGLSEAEKTDNKELVIRGNYLLSAAYRSSSLQTKETRIRKELSQLSRSTTNTALSLLENGKNHIKKYTKGKTYLCAGSFYHDIENNYEKALEFYNKALELFQPQSKDYNTVIIRKIRLLLEEGQIEEAIAETNKVKKSVPRGTKIWVNLMQVQAKIYLQQKEYARACRCISDALETAERNNMKNEVRLLEELRQSLIGKYNRQIPE